MTTPPPSTTTWCSPNHNQHIAEKQNAHLPVQQTAWLLLAVLQMGTG